MLHQWNFDIRGEDLILWRRRHSELNLSKMLEDRAVVRCGMVDGWLLAVLTKRA